MITFVTLFLGLALGPQSVEVAVESQVARVELRLDGEVIGTLSPPSWKGLAPLGVDPIPRELVAVAFDSEGQELGRTSQRLNVPRKAAEMTVSFDSDEAGSQWARLSWENATGDRPIAIRAFVDGEAVEIENPEHIALPALDRAQLHVFRAEMDFPSQISVSLDTTFGGSYGEAVNSELTAIPVMVHKKLAPLTPAGLAEAFKVEGQPTKVAAIEEGKADFVFVLDRSAIDDSHDLLRRSTFGPTTPGISYALDLGSDHRAQIFWPASFRVEGDSYDRQIFGSRVFQTSSSGILIEIARGSMPKYPLERQRLADAVGVAGLTAAERNRRRVVVLLVGEDARDSSLLRADQVRRMLQALDVPLEVWCVDSEGLDAARDAWGEVVDASSLPKLRKAGIQLRKMVESQRIVWLHGSYLPNQVDFSPAFEGVHRAGRPESPLSSLDSGRPVAELEH